MKKKNFIFITFLLLVVTYLAYSFNKPQNSCYVELNGQKFNVTLAKTNTERQLGLSGTQSLAINAGKLFVFDELGMHGFWMKDMNYPIDIIWFDQNLSVVGIKNNAMPESYPKAFYPEKPAQFVLEVGAGLVNILKIDLGTQATSSCTGVSK